MRNTEEGYTTSIDFWTLGVLLYEMAQNMSPFEGDTDEELFEQILAAPIEIEPFVSRGLKSAILGFLNRNPKERLGCSRTGRKDCEDHLFFKDIDWEKLANKEVKPPMVSTTIFIKLTSLGLLHNACRQNVYLISTEHS